jgi:hypothetical protein
MVHSHHLGPILAVPIVISLLNLAINAAVTNDDSKKVYCPALQARFLIQFVNYTIIWWFLLHAMIIDANICVYSHWESVY